MNKVYFWLVVIATAFLLITGLKIYDRKVASESRAFAERVQGKTLMVAAYLVNDGAWTDQKISIIAQKVTVAQGSEIRVSGPLTIEPPEAGCELQAVTKIAWSEIQISWKCGDVLSSQDFNGLYLVDFDNSPLWSYVIIPTGAKQQ